MKSPSTHGRGEFLKKLHKLGAGKEVTRAQAQFIADQFTDEEKAEILKDITPPSSRSETASPSPDAPTVPAKE